MVPGRTVLWKSRGPVIGRKGWQGGGEERLEVRDPIYGLIEYGDLEEKIINHRIVQRLRNIKQLAMAHLVYPGALHTRFDHSLGVMHIAGVMGKSLGLDEDACQLLRLAGLLHDVGHGPFSHVCEQVMQTNASPESIKGIHTDQFHEALTVRIIGEYLGKLIPDMYKGELISIFQKTNKVNLIKSIITGPIDADKIDYLLRDSYFTGVKYGVFDRHKVIESLRRVELGSCQEQVGISEEGIFAVEQLLLGRYHMRMQVSGHRIRRIADAMLVRAINLALQENLASVERVFLVNTTDLKDFLEQDDNTLLELILAQSQGPARDLVLRLKERRLLKEAFSIPISEAAFRDHVDLVNVRELDGVKIERAEERLAEMWQMPRELVIVDKQSIKNPTYKDPVPKLDPNSIMVLVNVEKPIRKDFPQVSAVFKNLQEPFMEGLYVYAPLEGSKEERKAFCKKHKEKILEVILQVAKEGE